MCSADLCKSRQGLLDHLSLPTDTQDPAFGGQNNPPPFIADKISNGRPPSIAGGEMRAGRDTRIDDGAKK